MKKHTKIKILFALTSLLMIIGISKTEAFTYYKILGNLVRWKDPGTIFSLNIISFPIGDTTWEPNFTNAVDQWNAVVFNLDYKINKKPCTLGAHHDGTNCVTFIHQNCEDYSGKTFPKYNSFGKMKEADIWFDMDCLIPNISNSETSNFSFLGYPYPYSFRYLSLHELGHSLYLGHAFDEVSVMNYQPNFERLMEDDKNAARFLYVGLPETDLSVSTDKDIPGTSDYLTQVNRSLVQDQLTIEYTIQNMGTTDASNVDVSFYLENIVNQVQIPLGTSYFDLPVHSSGTFSRDLVIPALVPPGAYNVYFEIDKLEMFKESDETNNRLSMPQGPILIKPQPFFTFEFPNNSQNVSQDQVVDFTVNVCNQGTANADLDINTKIFFPDTNLIYVSGLDSYPFITLTAGINIGDCLPVHLTAQVSTTATSGEILPVCAQVIEYDNGASDFSQSPTCGHFTVN